MQAEGWPGAAGLEGVGGEEGAPAAGALCTAQPAPCRGCLEPSIAQLSSG